MRTNINLNDALVREAMKLTKCKTKREVIHLALEFLVKQQKRKNLLDLKGKIQFQEDFDYKASRERAS